jgi:hypothetical protein
MKIQDDPLLKQIFDSPDKIGRLANLIRIGEIAWIAFLIGGILIVFLHWFGLF